ncbi:ABC transporter substrate-binding protein [Desulfosporosinus youngiae]|uniref:ABC-type Fe3+-hydroxamate transport system, periplasmic component n=1 Tax=Desulfosporosinus youngiae DSM 17734 TaxID=768710 RepID=H5XVA0_9FIRM|nr:ABC transporter substrate-binding protein [Desulfosporosinus youngiae]EHQ89698.1 ABC-type Fe3+-hydroxamate transport system, periplasmic component [Desulfosporosinus youngiae DSM 17734]
MKSTKKILALVLLTFFVLASLAGCGQQAPNGTNPPEKTAVTQTERTVVDMAGRSVKIPAEIKSIATFGSIGVLNAFVETLGEGSKIVNEGTASFTKSERWNKYQYLFAPQLKNAPVLQDANGEIVMEKVLQMKPDLCLVMTKEMAEQLAAQGQNVIYLSWAKQEDVKACITLLGEVLNKQDVAKDYLAYFDKIVAKAQDLTKNLKEADKKKVVYGNPITYSQPHIIAEWWIKTAGGISVTDNGRTTETLTYTLEDLLKWSPDVMLLSDVALKKDVLADKRYADISAVKNGQIYTVPGVSHIWGNRTTEQPLTILWTMNKLYPNIMTTEELGKEISYFYSHFFKYNLSDEQIKEIIGS